MQPSIQNMSLKALARPGQTLLVHSLGVSHHTAKFCPIFQTWTELIGLLHDYGKYRPEWVQGINAIAQKQKTTKLPHHAAEGAVYLIRAFKVSAAVHKVKLLALLIACHHTELPDLKEAMDWMMNNDPTKPLPELDDSHWPIDVEYQQKLVQMIANTDLQELDKLVVIGDYRTAQRIRFLYGSLVAADRQDAAKCTGWKPTKYPSITTLADRLAHWYVEKFPNPNLTKPLDHLRWDFYQECRKAALTSPGWLSVRGPCGISKTWSVMQMALDHAARWEKRRVVYCVPWTAILEQSYDQYRDVLGEDSVLGHWSTLVDVNTEDPRSRRNSRQWWDSPVVATTMVQLFDVLLCNKSHAAQRMPSLQDAVIVLDEVQGLPISLLQTCVKVLDQLVQEHGATIILSTATMPNYSSLGIDPLEALPQNKVDEYFRLTKRVDYIWRQDPLSWNDMALEIQASQKSSTLIVVNTINAANDVYQVMSSLNGYEVYKYTANMSPAHRSVVLVSIKAAVERSKLGGLPVIICATSAIETGVDLDCDQGYRELAGLESIVQFAGRVNRNLAKDSCPVFIFTTVQNYPQPPGSDSRVTHTKWAMALGSDLHSPEVLEEYSQLLFQNLATFSESSKTYDYLGNLGKLKWQEVSNEWEMIAPTTPVLVNPRLWDAETEVVEEFDQAIESIDYRVIQRHCVGLHKRRYDVAKDSKLVSDSSIQGLKEWVGDYYVGVL
jgi:CRISPR-associated endonuclease/helicase Cas3